MNDIKKKLENFNKRWNIASNSSYEEEFKKFKTRILNIFINIDRHISGEDISLFCNIIGIKEIWHHSDYGGHMWSTNIIDILACETNEAEFYRILEIIFSLPIQKEYSYGGHDVKYSKEKLYEETKMAVELSNINLAISNHNGEIIFYPKGEKEFDEKLVNQVISFLDKNSLTHFIDALHFYQTSTPRHTIKSAEALRRSIEEFLRYKLHNQQGLEKNIPELLQKLKEKKCDSAIRNIIFQCFSFLDKYFNENSKHQDGDIDSSENEFLIYQTGVLMRYIESSLK